MSLVLKTWGPDVIAPALRIHQGGQNLGGAHLVRPAVGALEKAERLSGPRNDTHRPRWRPPERRCEGGKDGGWEEGG
eukprot:1107883-Pyramimonas_sp.AAC.1